MISGHALSGGKSGCGHLYELHAYLIQRLQTPGIKIIFARCKYVQAFLVLILPEYSRDGHER